MGILTRFNREPQTMCAMDSCSACSHTSWGVTICSTADTPVCFQNDRKTRNSLGVIKICHTYLIWIVDTSPLQGVTAECHVIGERHQSTARHQQTHECDAGHQEQHSPDKDTHTIVGKLPWIFHWNPLTLNGASGNIQGNLTGMTLNSAHFNVTFLPSTRGIRAFKYVYFQIENVVLCFIRCLWIPLSASLYQRTFSINIAYI